MSLRYSEPVCQVTLRCVLRVNFPGIFSKCLQVCLAIVLKKLNGLILKNNVCVFVCVCVCEIWFPFWENRNWNCHNARTCKLIFRSVLRRMRHALDRLVEKIKTHVVWSIAFFFENHAFYEIIWKNIVQPDRTQMTIWRMHIAYFVSQGTDTHSECVIIIDFPQLQWFHERASALHYTYIVSLVPFYNLASDSFLGELKIIGSIFDFFVLQFRLLNFL